jgi:hypothetical protein
MVPRETATWHEAQIDELFRSLCGRREAVAVRNEETGWDNDDAGELRIFG